MKKKFSMKARVVLLLFGLLTVIKVSCVQAAYIPQVSGLRQTEAGKDSVTIAWDAADNATEYKISYKEMGASEYIYSGKTNGTSYTVSGLKDGVKYYVQVVSSDGTKDGAARTLYDAITLPDKIEGLRQKSWYYFIHVLEIEWNKKSGVQGYEVSLYNSNGKQLNKTETTSGMASFRNINDSVYTVQARAYTTFNGTKYYSSVSSINCIPQARLNKVRLSGAKLSLSWKKVSGATGYRIYVSTKKNSGYKLAKTVGRKKGSCTITKIKGKKLKPKKTYYVYVVTVCKKGKQSGTSGALYAWNSKNKNYHYLNR